MFSRGQITKKISAHATSGPKVITYISCSMRHFYGTEFEILAGFGLIDWKLPNLIYYVLVTFGDVFYVFMGNINETKGRSAGERPFTL